MRDGGPIGQLGDTGHTEEPNTSTLKSSGIGFGTQIS